MISSLHTNPLRTSLDCHRAMPLHFAQSALERSTQVGSARTLCAVSAAEAPRMATTAPLNFTLTPTPTPNATIYNEPDWDLKDRVNYAGCVFYGLISLCIVVAYALYHDARRKWFKIGVHNSFFLFSWAFCICANAIGV